MPAGREVSGFRNRIKPACRVSGLPLLDSARWWGARGEVEKFSDGLAVVSTKGLGIVASY